MDISNLSVAELKTLLTQIPKEIDRREKEEKYKLIKELEALASERGFNLNDLVVGGEAVKSERAPVAVKYRHPSNVELCWTGRGRQPKWVVEFVQGGGTFEQLAV